MTYPSDMDAACVPVCDALNALRRITTTGSCCGHGETAFRVLFVCPLSADLQPVLEAIGGLVNWRVEVGYHAGVVYYTLLGPTCDYAEDLDRIVAWLRAVAPEDPDRVDRP